MTLLFFDAIQDTPTLTKPEWSPGAWQGGGVTGRDGQANGAASAGSTAVLTPPGASGATAIIGGAVNSLAFGAGNPLFIVGNASGNQTWFVLNGSGFIEVRRSSSGGTLLGTSSSHAPISPGSGIWRHVGAKLNLQSSATGSVIVQVDGVTVLSVSSVQTAGASGNPTTVTWPQTSGNITPWNWDDIYYCDSVDATSTQGQPNNDLLGDVKVAVLLPSAAGDTTAWTPSTGTNFGAVDEVPPNTSDYVSTSTSGARDLYALADPSTTTGVVYGVRVVLYGAKSDAGAATVKPIVKQGGTITNPSALGLSTSFVSLFGPMMPVRPSDSAVWTASDLSALQAGVELG